MIVHRLCVALARKRFIFYGLRPHTTKTNADVLFIFFPSKRYNFSQIFNNPSGATKGTQDLALPRGRPRDRETPRAQPKPFLPAFRRVFLGRGKIEQQGQGQSPSMKWKPAGKVKANLLQPSGNQLANLLQMEIFFTPTPPEGRRIHRIPF